MTRSFAGVLSVLSVLLSAAVASAQSAEPVIHPRTVEVHGFISAGGFVSTANNYIGRSSHGDLKLFEAGLNVSTELTDRLRAGAQLFARDFGAIEDPPRFDWAFLDYRWRSWLSVRAGLVRMPFGLYNEYVDIDAARLPILMPHAVYPFRARDVLLAHRGFALYGNLALGDHELDYQAWLGTLTIPRNVLPVTGATLDEIDTRYVAGGQLFWQPPLAGLRVGATAIRTSIDFHLTLSPETVAALIMAGLVPPTYDGRLVISQRPDVWLIGSAEYTRGDWLFAVEYARTLAHQITQPALIPPTDTDNERFYALASVRLSPRLELGGYYSVLHVDASDRRGRDPMLAEPFHAFQRDLAATVRLDINEHWLWKLEAHLIDGTADLTAAANPTPERVWGLFLVRTTVTF